MIPSIITDKQLTVLVKGKTFIIDRDHVNFALIIDAINNNHESKVYNLIVNKDLASFPKKYAEKTLGKLSIKDGKLYKNGVEIHNAISRRINDFYRNKLDHTALLSFVNRLENNPSYNSREQLYSFLENKNIPIDKEGYFYAYKVVRSDFWSKTTGTLSLVQGKTKGGRIYNAPGEVIECNRSDVDDDPTKDCSNGLHVGSFEYSGPNGSFYNKGDRVVIVKVDPADCVSVPKGHHTQKMRVCKYEVVAEYTEKLPDTLYGE